MQDTILKGELSQEDCQSEELYQFLNLLKIKDDVITTDLYELINEEEQKNVVMKAKKRSASLIFSNRMYAVYKSALESIRIIQILVKYYNIIIKQCYYPK